MRRSFKWQMATASASLASRAQSGRFTPNICATMKATCSFSARPAPTRLFLTWVGAYPVTGRPATAQAAMAAPRAWPSFRAEPVFLATNTDSMAASLGPCSMMSAATRE